MELVIKIFSHLEMQLVMLACLAALITSSIHGATGVAGGFLLSAALAPIIGVQPIVPVITVALLISHTSRAILNRANFDRGAFLAVSLPAIPCIAIMALIYGKLPVQIIAITLGLVILVSIPLRRWAKSRSLQAGKPALAGIGMVYGGLSGVSIGPGMLLVPFLLGYGLSKEAFVATLAVIALVTNITRFTVFGATDLLNAEYFALGILCGLVTIPGNWIGRNILRKMTNERHATYVDYLAVLGALNFFWMAINA